MSEPDSLKSPADAEFAPEPAGPSDARLHQPWRGWVAGAEAVVAVLMAAAAVWMWKSALVPVELPGTASTRYLGGRIVGSTGLGVLSGGLVLDAFRQTVLAVSAGRRSRVDEPGPAPTLPPQPACQTGDRDS